MGNPSDEDPSAATPPQLLQIEHFPVNLTLYNFSAQEFWAALSDFKNYQVLDSGAQAFVIFGYVTLIVVGLVLNALVCYVILKQSKRKSCHVSGKSRNLYILNLAVADLSLCCISMPFTLRNLLSFSWTMGILLCKLTTMIQATHMLVTAGTVSAIAIDRFNTIVRSLRVRTHSAGGGGGKLAVVIIWLLSLLLTSPIFFYTHVESVNLGGIHLYDKCVENWPSGTIQLTYSIILSCVIFLLPTLILSVINRKISAFLKKHLRPLVCNKPQIKIHSPLDQKNEGARTQADNELIEDKAALQNGLLNIVRKESTCSDQSQRSESSRKYSDCSDSKRYSPTDLSPRRCFLSSFRENSDASFSFSHLSRDNSKRCSRRIRREQRTSQLLFCIAAVYAISWLPYNVYNVITNLNPFIADPPLLYLVFAISHLSAMTSVCINPFIYGWLNTNFRCEFVDLFTSLSNGFSKLFKKSSKIININSPYSNNDGGFAEENIKKKTTLSFIPKKSGEVRVALFANDSKVINI